MSGHPLKNIKIKFKVQECSDHSFTIAAESLDSADHYWVIQLHHRILALIPQVFLNSHPAYENLMVSYNPVNLPSSEGRRIIEEVISALGSSEAASAENSSASEALKSPEKAPIKIIPVIYGGVYGPDLPDLSKSLDKSEAEIIGLHTRPTYEVAFLGFAPGFPYLKGLDVGLHCPRKATPRLKVAAGSVGLAGSQTGIYPQESPGGWQLIGRTPIKLFDPAAAEPSFLQPGDRLLFQASQNLNFEESRSGKSEEIDSSKDKSIDLSKDLSLATLEILSPGFLSSVQDFGRPGFAHLGVSAGGAADSFALQEGNRLLGNSENAAAIEMTATGATFRFLKPSWGCLTGSSSSPRQNGHEISMWTTYSFNAGDTLQIGNIEQGLRSYLCLQGGIDVPYVLGSRSTFLAAGWGGLYGRALQTGDLLLVDAPIATKGFQRSPLKIRDAYSLPVAELSVTRGPQWHWFTEDSQQNIARFEFEVSTECNRLGLRLMAPPFARLKEFQNKELPTEGVANGSLQITPSGQVMILFCEQQTTGGYPKMACIRFSELSKIGQLRPGQKLRFHVVA